MSTATTRLLQTGWNSLRPGLFARHVATLAGGTAVSQVIILSSAPLLTRLYSPEAFGIAGAFLSLQAILLCMMCGGYEFATPVAEDEQTAANLTVLCGGFAIAMAATFALIVWFAGDWVVALGDNSAWKPYLWLLPLVLLVGAWLNAILYWSLRKKAYAQISHARIAQATSRALLQGAMGWAWAGPLGLILGEALAIVGGAGILGRLVLTESFDLFRKVSVAGIVSAAKRYVRFPLLTMPGSLVGGMATGLPCVLLPILFGTTEAGLFFVARRLAFAPTTLIGCAVGNVFFVELAEGRKDKQKIVRQFFRLSSVLLAVALLGAFVLYTAPSWAALLFGDEWDQTGWILAAMAPMLIGWFVVTPLSRVYYIFEKQHLLAGLELLRFVLTAAVLFIGASTGLSVLAVVLWLSVVMLLVYCLNWVVMASILKQVRQDNFPDPVD